MKRKKDIPKWAIEFRVFCARKDLTVEDVANFTGLSRTIVSLYRVGKKRPSLKSCEKMKKGIGFDMYKALYESYREENENEQN